MSRRPLPDDALQVIQRASMRMAPGGLMWSESPIPRPGKRRVARLGTYPPYIETISERNIGAWESDEDYGSTPYTSTFTATSVTMNGTSQTWVANYQAGPDPGVVFLAAMWFVEDAPGFYYNGGDIDCVGLAGTPDFASLGWTLLGLSPTWVGDPLLSYGVCRGGLWWRDLAGFPAATVDVSALTGVTAQIAMYGAVGPASLAYYDARGQDDIYLPSTPVQLAAGTFMNAPGDLSAGRGGVIGRTIYDPNYPQVFASSVAWVRATLGG